MWIQCSTNVLEDPTSCRDRNQGVENHNKCPVYLEAYNISDEIVKNEHKVHEEQNADATVQYHENFQLGCSELH